MLNFKKIITCSIVALSLAGLTACWGGEEDSKAVQSNVETNVESVVAETESQVAQSEAVETEKFVIVNSDGKEVSFNLEIANTDEKRVNGLMHREEIGTYEGMVFPADEPRVFSMWMKDTKIPLDMVFVDTTGEIQHVHWEATPLTKDVISYYAPVKAVIELKGGIAIDENINPGDKIIHPMFVAANLEKETTKQMEEKDTLITE